MGFDESWLRQREPYDHAARSSFLARRFGEIVGPARVLDLGGGLGSGARYLQRHAPGLDLCVVDHDEALLDVAAAAGFDTHRADLRRMELPKADALHCQALLDLVSWDWLQAWVDQLVAQPIPLLATLTVDGRMAFDPVDADDDEVLSCFRAHQSLDRGFGVSPGPRAAHVLAKRLAHAGWEVLIEPSDWHIPASDEDMVRSMVDGIVDAAAEMATQPARVRAWGERRTGGLTVGHLDLLAVPPA